MAYQDRRAERDRYTVSTRRAVDAALRGRRFAWATIQEHLVREGRCEAVDREKVAEEIERLGVCDQVSGCWPPGNMTES